MLERGARRGLYSMEGQDKIGKKGGLRVVPQEFRDRRRRTQAKDAPVVGDSPERDKKVVRMNSTILQSISSLSVYTLPAVTERQTLCTRNGGVMVRVHTHKLLVRTVLTSLPWAINIYSSQALRSLLKSQAHDLSYLSRMNTHH